MSNPAVWQGYQIWETDTQERTCNEHWRLPRTRNEHKTGHSTVQSTVCYRMSNEHKPNVERMKRTNNKCLPDTTNIQRKNNEQTEDIGQYEHTSDNYRICVFGILHFTPSPSLQDAQNFPTNLTNITRHAFWRMTAEHKKNIKRTLLNNSGYNPFLVRMADPAKCDRGIHRIRGHSLFEVHTVVW